ncbi:MAG: mechanosensitive ion channel family protein [Alphaproteobacteria bacterium]|nr:mechanosensitive ion channel family protein [Alphaproteobacteria bacterium]
MSRILQTLEQTFGPEAVSAAAMSWLPAIIASLLTLIVFRFIWTGLDRVLRRVLDRVELEATAAAFLRTAVRSALMIVGLLAALDQLGVDTSAVLASLGVAGITLGFAARDAMSNIISGVFIFWDRPFVMGDLVEIDGSYGRVEAITLRSTRLVTPDGRMLAIPNSIVVNTKVASYTNFPNLRLDIPITIGVNEDLGRVRALLVALLDGDPRYKTDPKPMVGVTALNDYNVEIELRAWLVDEKTHVAARMELRERAFEALRAAGVDMPYETLALAPVELKGAAAK